MARGIHCGSKGHIVSLFVAFSLIAAALLSRPMIFGYSFGPMSVAFSILAAISAIASSNKKLIHTNDFYGLAVILSLGYLYSAILLSVSLTQAVANFAIISSFSLAAFLSFGLHRDRLLTYIKWLLRVIVISGLITGVYFYVYGLSAYSDTWVIFSIPTDRDDLPIALIRFPFSTVFSDFTSGSFVGARSSFLAVEPGVSPALLVLWRCLEEDHGRRQIFRDFIFILAMLFGLSTTAPISLGLYFFFRRIISGTERSRLWGIGSAVVILTVFILVFLYAPYFGYYAKSETHFSSFDTRLSWFTDGGSAFVQISTVVLCICVFTFLKPCLSRDAALIAPTFIVVCALNVLEFSPLFILGVFVSIRRHPFLEWKNRRYSFLPSLELDRVEIN